MPLLQRMGIVAHPKQQHVHYSRPEMSKGTDACCACRSTGSSSWTSCKVGRATESTTR